MLSEYLRNLTIPPGLGMGDINRRDAGDFDSLIRYGLGNAANPVATGSGGIQGNWPQRLGLVDGPDGKGWGGLALGALQGLGSGLMAMQQYGLAKDTLNFQRDAFERNMANQVATTNAALEDRQRARVASNPGAYQSVAEYMDRNRVS